MRTGALLLAILLGTASIPAAISTADAAPKKKAKVAEPEDLNANGKKAVMDGLPLIMPSAVMFWMLHQKEVQAKEAKAKEAKGTRVAAKAKKKS